MKHVVYLLVAVLLHSCSATNAGRTRPKLLDNETFLLTEISTDPTYGHSDKNPVQTGGGPTGERRFLNALAGPNGEQVSYHRAGSCCPVESENGLMGMALLDHYLVTWNGSTDTASIYINMYDYAELKAPVGFSIRK